MKTFSEKWHYDKWSSTLPPIREKLNIPNKAKEIVFFYYSFANYDKLERGHIYINEAIFAYNCLLKNTNLAEYGSVVFFVDRLLAPIAHPIFRDLGLLEIVEYINVGNLLNLGAYWSLFRHPRLSEYRYVVNTNSDMWFIGENIDIGELVKRYDEKEGDSTLFAHENDGFIKKVEKVRDGEYDKNLINYYRAPEVRERAERIMYELFNADFPPQPRYSSGKIKALRTQTQLADHLHQFYEQYGDAFQDDEAFISVFLSKHRDIDTSPPLPDSVRQCSPRHWEDKLYTSNILVDIGLWSNETQNYPKIMDYIKKGAGIP